MIKLFTIRDYEVSADQRQYVLQKKGFTRYLKSMERVIETIIEQETKKDCTDLKMYLKELKNEREETLKEFKLAIKDLPKNLLPNYWETDL